MDNIKNLQELILLSIKKKDIMQKILDVTKRQKKFIDIGKIDTVIKQLELRDDFMKEVDSLDLVFHEEFSKLKDNLQVESLDKIDIDKYPQIKNLKDIVDEIMDITKEIKVIDDENVFNLHGDKDEIGNKLKAMRQRKKMSNAYRGYKKQVTSIFFDDKK